MAAVTKLCLKCHTDLFPEDVEKKNIKTYKTLSYTDAMHTSCIRCHEASLEKDTALKARKPYLAVCSNCHNQPIPYIKDNQLFQTQQNNKWVVIPGRLRQ